MTVALTAAPTLHGQSPAVFYEFIAYKKAFDSGSNIAAIIAKVLSSDP